MTRQRRLKNLENENIEEDFVSSYHREIVEFHPHCFIQPLALAQTKRFEEMYALAHSRRNQE
jgi:hypothetical protein